MPEIWILLALSAAVLYGISQAIGKLAIDSLTAPSMVAVNFLVSMPIYILFLFCFLLSLGSFRIGSEYIIFGLVAALLGRAGYYTYLEALERGPVMIVGSITAAYPAIITVLAITLLGESLTSVQAAGVSLVIVSMIGLSFSHGSSKGSTGFTRLSLILSIVTLILWGVWGIFVKLALRELPIVFYLGLYSLVLPPLFYTYIKHKRIPRKQILPKWSLPVIIAVIAVLIGQLALLADTAAVSIGEAAVVFPLIASYPIVMILLAFAFLKERLSRRDISLVFAVIIGIILISTT
jgi:transporter family protein